MILLHTALACEARPLIQQFRLREGSPIGGFRLYEGDNIRLIISGPHRVPTAAAMALVGGLSKTELPICLNIGVAGHGTACIGDLFLANKVIDGTSKKCWYPGFVGSTGLQTAPLVCVEAVTTDYPKEGLVDMESAGFVPTAHRFSCSELVHCLKVVSDNPSTPARQVSKEQVSDLIAQHIPSVELLIRQLDKLAHPLRLDLQEPRDLAKFLSHYSFSRTQEHQIKDLLQRWEAIREDSAFEYFFDKRLKSKALIPELQSFLDQLPPL